MIRTRSDFHKDMARNRARVRITQLREILEDYGAWKIENDKAPKKLDEVTVRELLVWLRDR